MDTASFIVRPASMIEDFEYVTRMATQEMCPVGPSDVTHVGPHINPGFFIAELNGEHIGCVSAVRHGKDSNSVFFIGFYIIDKKYRGQGYGMKMWNVMWESIDKSCMVGLDAVINMAPQYEKWGLSSEWINVMYTLTASKVVDTLSKVSLEDVTIKELEEVNRDSLFAYYASVIGVSASRSFFEAWTTIPEMFGFVATNAKNGEILGYIGIRDSALSKEDKFVGPLFAESTNIAQVLLRIATENVVSEKGVQTITVIAPIEKNTDAAKLFETELGGKVVVKVVRMYSNGPPAEYCVKKIYCTNSGTFD